MYATQFTLGSSLVLLLGILGAFASLDAVVLSRIRHLEARPLRTDLELRSTQDQIRRLARMVLVVGSALGAGSLLIFALILILG